MSQQPQRVIATEKDSYLLMVQFFDVKSGLTHSDCELPLRADSYQVGIEYLPTL